MSKKKCCKEEDVCQEVKNGGQHSWTCEDDKLQVPVHCDGKTACEESCVIVLEDSELEGLRDFDRKLNEAKSQLADIFMQKREFVKSADANLESIANTLEAVRNDYITAAKALAKVHGVDMDLPNQGNWSLSLSNKTLTKV